MKPEFKAENLELRTECIQGVPIEMYREPSMEFNSTDFFLMGILFTIILFLAVAAHGALNK